MNQPGASVSSIATQAQFQLLSRLAEADTPREVADVIVRLSMAKPTCKAASVLWALDGTHEAGNEPVSQVDSADLALARAAAAQTLPAFSADGHRLAIKLFEASAENPTPAVLLLSMDSAFAGQRFVDETLSQLKAAGRHLCRALESSALNSHERLERSESLQRALFAISDLAGSDRDMPDMLRGIHAIVGTLMYAENFFIVLHDAEHDTLQFLYYADVEDPKPPGDNLQFPMPDLERSLT